MAGESLRTGALAFGKQTAKGTALANPVFYVPKLGGGVKDLHDVAEMAVTGPSLSRFGQYKQRSWGGGVVQLLCHPEALGLLIYECMGAQAVSGAGPYTHTFTMADTIPDNNPLTVWDMVSNKWTKFTDMYVNRIKFTGASGEYIVCEVEFVGLRYDDVAAPGTLPALADPEPRMKYIGSIMKAEADSATPATMTNIVKVDFEVDRQISLQFGSALTPYQATPNARALAATLGIRYDSAQQAWDFYNMSATGQAASGGGPNQALGLGSFDLEFGRHPASAGRFLKIVSNGQIWQYAVEKPEASPGGGPTEMDADGQLIRAAAGATEVTITLVNDTVAVY